MAESVEAAGLFSVEWREFGAKCDDLGFLSSRGAPTGNNFDAIRLAETDVFDAVGWKGGFDRCKFFNERALESLFFSEKSSDAGIK